jgi:hypothetical protein
MLTQNGTPGTNHHMIGDRLEAVRSGVKHFAERVAEKAGPRARSFGAKATEMIKAHPIAAAATAVGLGYLIVRIARR